MAYVSNPIVQNEFEWQIRGQCDLSAAGAVGATRGTNQTVTKTATGTYTVVIKGTQALKLVEILSASAWMSGALPVVVALGARVASVVQATDGSDDITITLKTTATAGGSGADTDITTNAVTFNWFVVLRVGKMGNPL